MGPEKGGHYERGLFTGEISRISKFSSTSRKRSESPFFSTVWVFSRNSRRWTFLKNPFFQKTPFSEPDCGTPRILGKERKSATKRTRKVEKKKKQKEIEKSKDWRQIQEYCLAGGSWSTVRPLASALQEGPKPYSCLPNQQRGSPSWKQSKRPPRRGKPT